MLASLSPPRRRLVLILLALLLLCTVAVAAVSIAKSTASSAHRAVSQQILGPVLLVPGYGGSTTSLQPLAAKVRAAGRDAVIVNVPDGGTGDLNVQAKALDVAAHRAMSSTAATSVDVIGYSAGGVVARLWVRSHGGAGIARRIVTMGSPQHGTQLADLGASLAPSQCPIACQQLATTSSLLAALNSGDETPAGTSFVSIWTTADDVVLPAGSARLAGADVNITVQTVCAQDQVKHSGLPTDPVVQQMVLTELGAGAPASLTAANCAAFSS